VTLALGSASGAFAKAHDQGVADGTISFPNGTGAAVGAPGGVSGGQKDGLRGATASANGGDNRVNPVVGNGANEPD
jgi:hypothetical protein